MEMAGTVEELFHRLNRSPMQQYPHPASLRGVKWPVFQWSDLTATVKNDHAFCPNLTIPLCNSFLHHLPLPSL
jgi:hypothetical protein